MTNVLFLYWVFYFNFCQILLETLFYRQEDELYRMVIATYEQRQKELIVENTSLRDSLASIQKELVQLLKASLSQVRILIVLGEYRSYLTVHTGVIYNSFAEFF